jgi:acetyltransferase-like isoleucine patch superfamily enzyme
MQTGMIIGNWPNTIKHTQHYFMERYCFVDCRGEIHVDDTTVFGYGVNLITMSHDISKGTCDHALSRRLRVDGHGWIASFVTLIACWIQEHGFVAGGSVVSGVIVPSYTLVEGNPAQIVATYSRDQGKWQRLVTPLKCETWQGRK